MVSSLEEGLNRLGLSPGGAFFGCVVGQNTLPSRYLSLPRSINGYQQI